MYRSQHKKKKTDTGVGYGGDDRHDKQLRTQGRAEAEKKETDLVARQLGQLRESHEILHASCKSPPTQELINTLRLVLRTHDPTQCSSEKQGKDRRQLLEAALHTCKLITKHHPKVLGNDDDDESIMCALEELAQTSELIVHHNDTKQQNATTSKAQRAASRKAEALPEQVVKLAAKVLITRKEAKFASSVATERADCLAIDSHEHYRKALRPHCFEFVEQLKGHAFAKKPKSSCTNSSRSKALLRELLTYKTALPVEYGSSIFVRADQGRSDLLRALILGPEDTPYANGCFVFDIWLPSQYPNKPPEVKFLTTGGGKYRLNPNLYNCGKVCLSLLGTWSGPGWVSGESTLLQVLLSLQSLIFVPDPYFNEPGYQSSQGTPHGKKASESYNANIRMYTTSAGIVPFLTASTSDVDQQPYPEFAIAIAKHYELKRYLLQQQLYHWNQDDKTRGMTKLYSECWKIWDDQQEQQKLKSTKRKRQAPTPSSSSAVAKFTVDDDGILVLDDDDSDDDVAGDKDDQDKEVVTSSKSNKKKAVEIDLLDDDDDDDEVVEVVNDDDNSKKPPAVERSALNLDNSVGHHDSQQYNNSEDDIVVDLT